MRTVKQRIEAFPAYQSFTLELETRDRIGREIVVYGSPAHSEQSGTLSRSYEWTFISRYWDIGFLLFTRYMLFSLGILVGMFGTTFGAIPRCAFAGGENRMTPLAGLGDFNSATHSIYAVISVNILLKVSNRVYWRLRVSKSSTTSLTGQPRLSGEIQPRYKNGRKIEQKRLKSSIATTKMAPRKECHTNRLC